MRIARLIIIVAFGLAAPLSQAYAQAQAQKSSGYAGSTVCSTCHAAQAASFGATPKGARFLQHPGSPIEKLGCEGCHGPSQQHAETGGSENGGMIAFSKKSKTPVAERNAICLQCHEKTARLAWRGGAHEARDVSCADCHTVMHTVSERGNLRKETVLATCAGCHQQRAAQQLRFSHMPIGQGKMECTSCHNPHGSANDKLLTAASTNEVCFTCHAEKRGPFLWQHPPVVENCSNCHDPHGTAHEKLLRVPKPRLCQQCHDPTSHPTQPRGTTAVDARFIRGRQCVDCHINIHGSNHPSGKRFTR
jgi:DmsE family decaheme c-type cytochrome